MKPWLSKSSASLLSAPSGAAPARPASWGLCPPQLGTHARLKRVPEIWALFLAMQTAGPHLLEAFLPLPYCVDARPSPACFGEPGQRSRQADRKSSIGVGALLEIPRAPLSSCPHLLTAGKGYASGDATLACCCAVGRDLGVPRQNFHGSSPRPRLQNPPADRPSLSARHQKERCRALHC